jgi:hypothetical protein
MGRPHTAECGAVALIQNLLACSSTTRRSNKRKLNAFWEDAILASSKHENILEKLYSVWTCASARQ